MSSTAASSALALTDNIKAALETEDLSNNAEARSTVLAEIAKLRGAVETPPEAIQRIWAQPMQNAALRVAVKIGVLNLLSSPNLLDENKEIRLAQLAEHAHCDPELVVRVMRVLTAMGVGTEVGPGRYTSNALSQAFTEPGYAAGVSFLYSSHLNPKPATRSPSDMSNAPRFDTSIPSLANLIPFLESTGYRNPTSCPFDHTHHTRLFTHLQAHPSLAADFHTFMRGRRTNPSAWLSTYPFHENLIPDSRPAPHPFLIDIGGSHGHDLLTLSTVFPTLPGPILLLDHPSTLSTLPPPPHPFIAIPHNFFRPLNPACHAARAYHLRAILHDYPTATCALLLKHIVDAMEVGYSKLIIREFVLREEGWALGPACNDLLMLVLHGGMERTERMWRELLGSAGLEITGLWGVGGEGVIEAVKIPGGGGGVDCIE